MVSSACETFAEPALDVCLSAIQFQQMTSLAQLTRERDQSFPGESWAAWDQLESIKFERFGEFWDIHVPVANHYSAAGIFHHNSGKTKIGTVHISQVAKDGEPWMAVSPDNNMIRDSAFPTFLQTVRFSGQYLDHNLSPTPRVTFRTRDDGVATVVFKGAEVPEKLRGSSVAGLWFDEASIIHKMAFDIAIACCRHMGRMGPTICTFTPRGFKHWTFESFYDGIDENLIGESYDRDKVEWMQGKPYIPRKDTLLVRCSTRQNPFAPKEYFERVAGNYSTAFAMQELEGDFIEISGMMFKREWFSQTVDQAPADCLRVRFYDKAATQSGGCYTVGLLMARDARGIYYIEDIVRGQWSAHERNNIMLQTARSDAIKYGGEVLTYIEQEGGGDGKTVIDQLIVMLSAYPVYRWSTTAGISWKTKGNVRLPGDAKVRRARPFSAQCEAGNVRLVLGATNGRFHRDFIDEITAFPEFAYCDQVDAASSAFNVLQQLAPQFGEVSATRTTEVAPKSKYGQTAQVSEVNSISRWSDLPWNQVDSEG
jgi:predicted phage terminase large subunit-like protein